MLSGHRTTGQGDMATDTIIFRGAQTCSHLNVDVRWIERSASRPGLFNPVSIEQEGWVSRTAGLDDLKKSKISRPSQQSNYYSCEI